MRLYLSRWIYRTSSAAAKSARNFDKGPVLLEYQYLAVYRDQTLAALEQPADKC